MKNLVIKIVKYSLKMNTTQNISKALQTDIVALSAKLKSIIAIPKKIGWSTLPNLRRMDIVFQAN